MREKCWNGTKNKQHFIPHVSRSLLYIRLVAVAFRSGKRSFFKKRPPTPLTYFCPALDPPLGRYGRNTLMHVRGHEHSIPTKFRKHPSSGSVVKAMTMCSHTYTCISATPPPLPWPGWQFLFTFQPKKHKLGRGQKDLASCQVC